MQQHWKKIVIGLVAVTVLVLGGSWFYANVLNDPQDRKDEEDLLAVVSTTTDAAPGSTTEGSAGSETTRPPSVDTSPDGSWTPASDSELCYRVEETINGFDTEGVGCTNAITGSLVIEGTRATTAEFTVDMATFESGESRRDGQFNGRIMEVSEFPTGTFVLTSPIDFGTIPGDGETVTVTATGDLTLHGVTKSVTFELTAVFGNGRIGVFGNIPVLFADYNIENPSFGTITTEDNGLLEFVLAFDRAG